MAESEREHHESTKLNYKAQMFLFERLSEGIVEIPWKIKGLVG